jgi:hypothetical protein
VSSHEFKFQVASHVCATPPLPSTSFLNRPPSNMASTYDAKYERTIEQLIREIQRRKNFIGAAWVDDQEDVDGEERPKREVRLLDYACGTGLVSRVSSRRSSLHTLPRCLSTVLTKSGLFARLGTCTVHDAVCWRGYRREDGRFVQRTGRKPGNETNPLLCLLAPASD